MTSARSGSARTAHTTTGDARRHPLTAAAFTLLVALSLWQVGYQLSLTLLPGLATSRLYSGVAPDIAFALAGGLIVARGLRREHGWVLIGLGAICWAAGDMYWSLALTNLNNPPVPSWADAGYLLFCPLTFAGISALVRSRAVGAPKTLVADALAAALAAGAVSAAVVLQPVIGSTSGDALAVATNVAYPLVDMLLIGLIVGATALGNWRLQTTWGLLGLSAIVFWVADSLYLITLANHTYTSTAWFNALWNASPLLAGWAAWLPHRAAAAQPNLRAWSDVRGIVMPLLFALTALGLRAPDRRPADVRA